jgi:pyrroline-5-carboxylate reductase
MGSKLGIIGAGNMAEAIVRGVLSAGVLTSGEILAADVSPARRDLFTKELHVAAVENPAEVAKQSQTLLLSVKPQQMATVLAELSPGMAANTLVISIAAGISSAFIEKHLGRSIKWRVVRTMPNTPMLVGEGMVAIAPGAHATAADLVTARRLFESAASVIEVREDQIDAVTAVSGSGPAYFFFLVEQMVAAGVALGLSPEQAHQLAVKTALGSAKMLVTSPDSPAELRRKVTSPGGTTHAAITHMQNQHVDRSIIDALKAAAARGKELGQ